MKSVFSLFVFFFSTQFLFSQEVILTKAGIPRSGSRYLMKYNLLDTMFSLSQFNLTGTDNIWDFSQHNFQSIDTLSFDTITSLDTSFQSANLVATSLEKNDKLYFSFSEGELLVISSSIKEFFVFGGPLNPIYETQMLRYKFPWKY